MATQFRHKVFKINPRSKVNYYINKASISQNQQPNQQILAPNVNDTLFKTKNGTNSWLNPNKKTSVNQSVIQLDNLKDQISNLQN